MDKLKELFKNKLSVHTDVEERGEWLELDTKLSRLEFNSFNLFKFNVYYASAIAITVVGVIGSFLFYFNQSKTTSEKNVNQSKRSHYANKIYNRNIDSSFTIIKQDDKTPNSTIEKNAVNVKLTPLQFKNSTTKFNPEKEKINSDKYTNIPAQTKINFSSKIALESGNTNVSKPTVSTATPQDSNSATHLAPVSNLRNDSILSSTPLIPLRKKVIKKVYLTKRDTIYEYDSVKIKTKFQKKAKVQ